MIHDVVSRRGGEGSEATVTLRLGSPIERATEAATPASVGFWQSLSPGQAGVFVV